MGVFIGAFIRGRAAPLQPQPGHGAEADGIRGSGTSSGYPPNAWLSGRGALHRIGDQAACRLLLDDLHELLVAPLPELGDPDLLSGREAELLRENVTHNPQECATFSRGMGFLSTND